MTVEKGKFRFSLKQLRERQGQSIEALAEESGVPLVMLEQLEQNVLPEDMMTSDAYRLAQTLHCMLSELFQ